MYVPVAVALTNEFPLTTCRPAQGFQLVVEPFDWSTGGAGGRAPLLQLHTPTAAAARLSLPAGRHLARLLTNPHSLWALDLRCNVPFHLDTLDKVCLHSFQAAKHLGALLSADRCPASAVLQAVTAALLL